MMFLFVEMPCVSSDLNGLLQCGNMFFNQMQDSQTLFDYASALYFLLFYKGTHVTYVSLTLRVSLLSHMPSSAQVELVEPPWKSQHTHLVRPYRP